VNGGKVIGGRGTGPSGTFGSAGAAFLEPLPINLKTGAPSASGDMTSQYSVLPTVLDIFGIATPALQKTEWGGVPAVIKPGHKAS